jgi:anti-sigma regulatory factor (Ser/Thr protein kinase)
LDTVELDLPAAPGAPRLARAAVRKTLGQWQLEALLDVAALLTSELVTNVVRHVGGPITLRVSRATSALRIEVDDRSPEPPAFQDVRPPSEHGRGVFLVDAMANDWGSRRTAVGKTVWFELELPSEAAEARGR